MTERISDERLRELATWEPGANRYDRAGVPRRENEHMLTTTLNAIRAHSPCASGWGKLLRHLGKTKADDELVPFAVILEQDVILCKP